MAQHALDERHELAATLRTVGPGAPTLCEGWTTSELAAHLLLRERSLTDMAGRLPVQRFRDRAEKHLRDVIAAQPYRQIVDEFERGASWPAPAAVWSLPPIREGVNLLEYVVHHEDVRRAGPAEPSVAPRLLPVARQVAVWSRLKFAASLTLRAVPVGAELVWPAHGTVVTRRAKHGYPTVTVTGEPVELALVAFGRQRAARVDYDGAPGAVEQLRTAHIAM
jgi:uncharacterized protein (TIGR03085 family)